MFRLGALSCRQDAEGLWELQGKCGAVKELSGLCAFPLAQVLLLQIKQSRGCGCSRQALAA